MGLEHRISRSREQQKQEVEASRGVRAEMEARRGWVQARAAYQRAPST